MIYKTKRTGINMDAIVAPRLRWVEMYQHYQILTSIVNNVNGRKSLITIRTVHNASFDFVIKFFVPSMTEISRIRLLEQFVGTANFQMFIVTPDNAFVCDA